jgi:hypothetical protein
MDRLKLVFGSLLKSSRTYITKISVSAFSVIKTFDVIEHIGFRFISNQVTCAIHSLAFHYSKEAFNNGIVVRESRDQVPRTWLSRNTTAGATIQGCTFGSWAIGP